MASNSFSSLDLDDKDALYALLVPQGRADELNMKTIFFTLLFPELSPLLKDKNGRTILSQSDINKRISKATQKKPADFSDTNLTGRKLRGNLYRANFSNADLSFANLRETDARLANFDNAVLDQAHFDKANLAGATFTKANAQYAYFNEALLDHANLKGTLAQYAHFDGAHLHDARLVSTQLNHASMRNAQFNDKTIFKATTLDDADLSSVVFFTPADSAGAYLQGVSCVRTKFTDAKMPHVSTDVHSDYTDADFTGLDKKRFQSHYIPGEPDALKIFFTELAKQQEPKGLRYAGTLPPEGGFTRKQLARVAEERLARVIEERKAAIKR